MTDKDLLELHIDALNSRGWGTAKTAKGSAEVIGALPTETIKAQVIGKKRKTLKALTQEVLKSSCDRVALRCAHAPACGGCTWQQMNYSAQLKEKQRRIKALFSPQEVLPIIAAKEPWRYRNKMEFTFSQNKNKERFLGLILAGSKGHVFNLTECHLVSPWFAELLSSVRSWWETSGLLAYRMNDTGSLRTLTVREGKNTGDKLVLLTVSGNPDYSLHKDQLHSFVKSVKSTLPEETHTQLSIFLRVQQAIKGSPTQFFEMHLFGKDHLQEILHLESSLHFKISPTSFFQPNTSQAEILYKTALDLVSFPKKHVLDLYAGTATLGMAMASKAESVTAIEINPHACFDAEANKELNGIHNLTILCQDVALALPQLKVKPDLVVLDPPRTGLGPKALSHLLSISPPEILYISCNPKTQAADIQELLNSGYELKAIQPVDQFPHTPHIENIVLLTR